MPRRSEVTVGELLAAMAAHSEYAVAAGPQGLRRRVGRRTIQRIGVAVTGYLDHMVRDRVQLIGRSESGYFDSVTPAQRQQVFKGLFELGFPALVITSNCPPPPELLAQADEHGIAVLVTDEESDVATERINTFLSLKLARRETTHGVLVDVYGIGVLLTGKSGIGKSELGLELVAAGHRLVADDLVHLMQSSAKVVLGSSPELTRHHMEIRGLGIVNIKDLFGTAAVRERKRIELVAQLVTWEPGDEYERLGLTTRYTDLAGVAVRKVTLPVRPGRSLRLILEVAARNELLQAQGTHSARAFADRLGRMLDPGGRVDDDPEEETAIE